MRPHPLSVAPSIAAVLLLAAATACARPPAPAAEAEAGPPGTTGAIQDPERADAAVPPSASALPDPADRPGWRRVLGWPDDCEADYDAGTWGAGLTFHPLDGDRQLVEVVCLVAAYQQAQLFLTFQPGPPAEVRLLRFPGYAPDGEGRWLPEEAVELAGDASFDAAARELTVSTRFRGLGDCGSVARWRIDGDAPELLELRGKAECDGVQEGWPSVLPAAADGG
jgi:hypothetical protein